MNLIDFYLKIIIFIVTYHADSSDALNPLIREIRFTKFDLKFLNQTYGIILECTIKQYGGKQAVFLHVDVKEKLTEFDIKFSVLKCKEYYIDCINVVSYDIFNACSKLRFLTHFNIVQNTGNIVQTCPVYGEYKYNNMTIDAVKFMSSFSNPTEKWWEYYWKINYFITINEKLVVCSGTMQFYFIQFRSRNH